MKCEGAAESKILYTGLRQNSDADFMENFGYFISINMLTAKSARYNVTMFSNDHAKMKNTCALPSRNLRSNRIKKHTNR